MSEVEDVWRRKNDEQLLEAFRCLGEYGIEGQRAIRAEFARRGLAEPSKKPLTVHEAETVARLHRRFAAVVCAQWLCILGMFLAPGSPAGSVLALLCVAVFLIAVVAVPMAGYRLLKGLGVESPRGTAFFMYMPLFSLLTLLGMRSFNDRWSREHGVDVGLLGPTNECPQRLRDAESSESGSQRVT